MHIIIFLKNQLAVAAANVQLLFEKASMVQWLDGLACATYFKGTPEPDFSFCILHLF
jgi:hypothetical protein